MPFRKIWTLGLAVVLTVSVAHAKKHRETVRIVPLTPPQAQLVDRAVAREHATVALIRKSTPVVQTYIQNMRPDPKLYAVPVSDDYSIARVDFEKAFTAENYDARASHQGFFGGTKKYLSDLTKVFNIRYSQTGFMDMMFMDPVNFDRQHYDFSYVRREFLGSIRTWVFDVRPKPGISGPGRFFGRIWIEDQDGNIVRFNGTFTEGKHFMEGDQIHYFHFDSWRTNVQPGEWLPTAIYVEETHHSADRKATGMRAQTYFWGYSLKLPQKETSNESIEVENAQDQSGQAQDVSPLQARREWVTQAENNVLDRLTQAGLLAPPSDFDKILETVTNNIIIGSKLNLPSDIHCRVLLTMPLESLAVGNTILISKGLIDTLPTEADLAAVLSFQLAHIVLGHHIDTRYAFNDRLLFPDEATFQRINMSHSQEDDTAAAKKAVELFNASIYAPKSGEVGLYFEQLAVRQKALTAMLTPRLGDSLLQADGTPWLSGLMHGAPRLNPDNLTQVAALPINSNLRIDPWDDRVYQLHATPPTLLNAGDKMPFEITPIYFRLETYQPPAQPVPTSAPTPGAAAGPQQGGTAEGVTETAVPTEGTSNPSAQGKPEPGTPVQPQQSQPRQPQPQQAQPQQSEGDSSNGPTEGTSNPPPVQPQS